MTKQEFLDEVAIRLFVAKVGDDLEPTDRDVSKSYEAAEALLEERERRRKNSSDWPLNTIHDSFEAAYSLFTGATRNPDGGYVSSSINKLFSAYSAGFYDCNDRYAG